MSERMRGDHQPEQAEVLANVAAWALEHRDAYPDRQPFNRAICERLAQQGVVPNAHVVYQVGRRGSMGAIASDVRAWLSEALARISAPEPVRGLPDSAQVVAHDLLRELQRTVEMAIRQEHESVLSALRESLGLCEQEVVRLRSAEASVMEQLQVAKLEIAQRDEVIASVHAKALEVQARVEQVSRERDALIVQMEQSRLGSELRDAKLQELHQTELRGMAEAHTAAIEALRAAHAEELKTLHAAHQQALDQERGRTAGIQRAFSLSLDEVRSQVRAAQDRIKAVERERDAALAKLDKVRGDEMGLRIELARQKAVRKTGPKIGN